MNTLSRDLGTGIDATPSHFALRAAPAAASEPVKDAVETVNKLRGLFGR